MEPPRTTDPSADNSRAEVLLREALYLLEPLASLLVTNGVAYPTFAQALKRVFLEVAEGELKSEGRKVTDSALSLLSGVHRKDVRALTRLPARDPKAERALSTASMVFAKWIRSDEYAPDGQPMRLRMRATTEGEPSFEQLAQSVSKDFHARSMLDELIRLGLAAQDGEWLTARTQGFVPSEAFEESAIIFGRNAHDHLAAAAANLSHVADNQAPPFLEHAVFADGLSEYSSRSLQIQAANLWQRALRSAYAAASQRTAIDENLPTGAPKFRLRFGTYCFVDEQEPGPKDSQPAQSRLPAETRGEKV